MNQPKTTSNLSRRRFLTGVAATAAAAVAFPHLAFGQAKKRKLVMIAGKPSHPAGMHEFNAGVYVLSQCLKAVPDLEVSVHRNHWVSDEKVLDDADALFIYSDGRQGHPAVQGDHKEKVAKLMARGVGLIKRPLRRRGGPQAGRRRVQGLDRRALRARVLREPDLGTEV